MKTAIIDEHAIRRQDVVDALMTSFHDAHIKLEKLVRFASWELFLQYEEKGCFDLIVVNVYYGENDHNCIEFVKKVHAIDKKVRFVFCNCGGTEDLISPLIDAFPFIVKPLTVEEISSILPAMMATDINDRHYILLPHGRQIYVRTIVYTECQGHYIYFHLTTKEVLCVRLTQKQLVKMLEPYSYVCTISCAINVNFQNVVDQKKGAFSMCDGSKVDIPRRRCGEVRKKYHKYLNEKEC